MPLPPRWTHDAIVAVSGAEMQLAARRERTAWLFRDARLAQSLDYTSTRALLPWLPAEDWTPVIKAFAERADLLELLQADAARKGRTGVACRLGRALRKSDAPCGSG